MSAMSISTLELLEQSDMPSAYARAITKAIETDFTHRLGNLTTKEDLFVLKEDARVTRTDVNVLKEDVRVLKGDVHILKEDVRVLKEDVHILKKDVHVLREDLLATKAELKSELKSEINGLRLEMAGMKTELSVDIREIKSDVVRWLFLGIMGQTALFSGIMYYLLRLTALHGLG